MVEIRPQALGRSQNILPNDACGVLEAVAAEALLLDLLVQRVQNRRVQRVLLDLVVGERLPCLLYTSVRKVGHNLTTIEVPI